MYFMKNTKSNGSVTQSSVTQTVRKLCYQVCYFCKLLKYMKKPNKSKFMGSVDIRLSKSFIKENSTVKYHNK